ncbi:MAG: GlsB/YeaQ/YmgE family stress response membrane protein [Lachnospiraceae bacterium]|nr:GlsB/YeaQ/YmgE family stress response membrane protein [Lachnospiraceae bacterium]
MSFIAAVIIGGVSGWLAGKIMKTHHSVIFNIILGFFGGLFGGWLGGLVGIDESGWISRIIISVIGACLLIWISRLINKND